MRWERATGGVGVKLGSRLSAPATWQFCPGAGGSALSHSGVAVKDCIVTVLGMTFKENVSDIRNSRVIDIVRELESYGAKVQVHDPVGDAAGVRREYGLRLRPLTKALAGVTEIQ